MTDMDEHGIVEAAAPAEAFGALADPMRVDILRALWDAEGNEATFTELRDQVGVSDSGRFNYHLRQLTDRFVSKTDDGYRLTVAGSSVVGSLLAGAYTRVGTVGPLPVTEPCGFCGGQRHFTYDDERARIECEDCDVGTHFRVPPGVFAEYEEGEFPDVTERYVRSNFQQADDGFCPYCEGRVDPRLATAETEADTDRTETDTDAADADADPEALDFDAIPTAEYRCRRCGETFTTDLGAGLMHRAPVVAFFHDHGVDVTEAPLSVVRATDAEDAVVEDRDPLRARVRYRVDGETLTLHVDETLTVLDAERTVHESGVENEHEH